MIRTRLTIWNAVVLALVLTLIGSIVYLSTQQILYGSVDSYLVRNSSHLERNVGRDWEYISRGKLPVGFMGRDRGPRSAPRFDNTKGNSIADRGQPRPEFRRDEPRDGGPGPAFHGEKGIPPPPPPEGPAPDAPEGASPEQARRLKIEWLLSRPRIFDATGKAILDRSEQPWDEETLKASLAGERRFSISTFLDQRVRIYSAPILYKGKVVAVAQTASSLANTDELMAKQVRTLLALLPIALLMTTLAGIYLTNHALRPVRDIARSAEKIEATSLSGRLDIQSRDEFGMLAKTFNSMLARLEASFHKMEEANELQRRFIADASHELKTPLTAIKTRVGVAKRGTPSIERYQEHLAAIGVSADSMTGIVQGLLLLARSDEGKLELRRTDVPLLAIADEAATLVRTPGRAKLELDVPAELDVCVDHPLFQRVLTNLLDNALRHTPSEGRVRLTARTESGSVLIEVADNGEGIPAEHVPHVFERFHRVDAARTRESGGTGLGLPIAKSIVEAHGGTITLDSEFGKGTTVRIALPQ